MNQQQILDTVYDALTKQQSASIQFDVELDGTASCVYFHESGNKCAVGHLLPDSPQVRLWMKEVNLNADSGVSYILDAVPTFAEAPVALLEWCFAAAPHEDLLCKLQRIHDRIALDCDAWNQDMFDDAIGELAGEYNLVSPVSTMKKRAK